MCGSVTKPTTAAAAAEEGEGKKDKMVREYNMVGSEELIHDERICSEFEI